MYCYYGGYLMVVFIKSKLFKIMIFFPCSIMRNMLRNIICLLNVKIIWEQFNIYNSANSPLIENNEDIINSSDSDSINDNYANNNKIQDNFCLYIDNSKRSKSI